MKHRQIPDGWLRLLLLGAGLLSCIFAFDISTWPGKSICACFTVNEVVIADLNRIDRMIQEYAATNGGLYPTYAELEMMLSGTTLTDKVNFSRQTFRFKPTEADINAIGYAVSDDQRHYVLIGVGKSLPYHSISLFGTKLVKWQGWNYSYPALRPGDTPSDPSPIMP